MVMSVAGLTQTARLLLVMGKGNPCGYPSDDLPGSWESRCFGGSPGSILLDGHGCLNDMMIGEWQVVGCSRSPWAIGHSQIWRRNSHQGRWW
jgi:hypothetical protein